MNLLRDKRYKEWFWLENEIIDREDLTIYEKMIYTVLARHTNSESTCFPSYNIIARKSGCSERQAKNCIKSLIEKNLIIKIGTKGRANVYQVMSARTSACDAQELVHEVHTYSACDALEPVHEVHTNNTNITIHNKNIQSLVIERLNKACNKNYKSSTPKTKKLIQARLNENFALEDFYKVIDLKSKEWLGSEMEKFLRPETLFGTKFESYLNQKVSIKNEIENVDDGFIPELQYETLK